MTPIILHFVLNISSRNCKSGTQSLGDADFTSDFQSPEDATPSIGKANKSYLQNNISSILWGVYVLGLRPPGLEIRIMCLEGSIIQFISPSPGGSPSPV